MLRTANDFTIERTGCFDTRECDPVRLVAARLRRSGHPYLYGVKCQALHGAVVLSGTVPTVRLKELAYALALHTPGVYRVENRLEVTGRSSSSRFAGRADP
jgi:hypothetical protein